MVKIVVKYNKKGIEKDRLGCFLKLPIFIVQNAAAPKNGVEFCQKSIGDIRCSLATFYDVTRCFLLSVCESVSE